MADLFDDVWRGVPAEMYETADGRQHIVFGDARKACKVYAVKVVCHLDGHEPDGIFEYLVLANNCYRAMELMDVYLVHFAHNFVVNVDDADTLEDGQLTYHAYSAHCVGVVVRNG